MTNQQFLQELHARVAKYDLLCHPFYKAWSAGALTREHLREYALDYYQHVHAFPSYLPDFAEGMGANRAPFGHEPVAEVRQLIGHFARVAEEGTPEEALAAFYAYESQVPRVAGAKERGLRDWYGADDKTTRYFTLHTTADVYHANVWREQLAKRVEAHPETAEQALNAAEAAARALWTALDGVEARRMQAAA